MTDSSAKGKPADGSRNGGAVSALVSVAVCMGIAKGIAYALGLDTAAAIAMGIQVVAWVPSALAKSEKFYDFTGMLSFISVALFSQAASIQRFFLDIPGVKTDLPYLWANASRHLVATSLVLVWTLRLGKFLFERIQRDGHDSRFNRVRDRPLKFLLIWTVQGLWVFLTPLSMLALHKLDPKGGLGEVQPRDAIGLVVWMVGFIVEVVADEQKRQFKQDKENEGRFIDTGLWSRCRHPNYVGEMMIWAGFFIFCSRGLLQGAGWSVLAGPAFVVLLFLFISTPALERGADKKYGGQAAYHEYKRKTPSLYFRFS